MNNQLRVLLVEEYENEAMLLLNELHSSGYELKPLRVATASQLQAALEEETWDIVISDYYLPQFSAPAALKLIKETGLDLPFIIVSDQIGEEAAIAALKAGAQDLVTKRNLAKLPSAVARELREANLRRQQRRMEQERQLLQTLTQCVSEAPDFHAAIAVALRRVCETTGWQCGEAWVSDDGKVLRCSSAWYGNSDRLQAFREYSQSLAFPLGSGIPGQVWTSRQPLWIPDLTITSEATFVRVPQARAAGLGAGLGIPILADGEVLAVLVFMMFEACIPDQQQVELISAVAAQLGAVLQRKRAEQALRRAEVKYRSLFENAVVGIFQTTPDGHYINANPALARIYGYDSPAELMAYLTDIEHQLYADSQRRDEFTRLMHQNDAVSEFESQIYRKDGSIIWILENARAVRDEMGTLLYYEGFVEDITERHQAEAALREAKENLEVRVEQRTIELRQANEQLKQEIAERLKAEALLAEQNWVLELILKGKPLSEILEVLIRAIEGQSPGMKCSFLLLDPDGVSLRYGAAPSLPKTYTQAWDGISIGPSVGSCGTAAYRKELTIVADIATDPLWSNLRDLALSHGLRSCTSIPILTLSGSVLGTFAMYYTEPRIPSHQDQQLIIKAIHLAGIAIDRQRAESALKRSKARFQKMVANVPGIIYQFLCRKDGSFSFPFVSARCREVYEVGPEVIQQNANFPIDLIHPDDRPIFDDSLTRCTQSLQPWNWEGRIITPSGQLKWIQGAARPERHANGETLWDGLVMDVTERKQAQEALQRSEAKLRQQATELEQALRELQRTHTKLVHIDKMSSLGQLVAGVAHEINNPISFLVGNLTYAHQYTQDLLSLLNLYQKYYPNPPSEIRAETEAIDLDFLLEDLPKMLDSMKLGTDRICQIVRSLRNFSRIDQAAVQTVDLHEGIDSTLLILQHRLKPRGGHLGIQAIKEYGNLPLVECYVGQLNQVFMNILSNAIDALEEHSSKGDSSIPNPQICIRTEVLDSQRVVVRIADNGPGIPEAVRSQLFDSFFTTKPMGKGTGLGLAISYDIVVEKHQGQLLVNSELGRGTEFVIEIPIHQNLESGVTISKKEF